MKNRLRSFLRRLPGFPVLRLLYRLLRGGAARQEVWLALRYRRRLFQPSGVTHPHRYPDLFAAARLALAGRPAPRLLSFGCSTGEEVFTLAEIFPAATVTGIDIAPQRIRACRARWRREGRPARLRFLRADGTAAEASEVYDAVFALAVFRHGALGGGPPLCRPLLDPDAVERALADLARVLKPGGLLVLRHANLRFDGFPLAAGFEPVYVCPPPPDGSIRTPIYGRDGRLRPGLGGDDGVYRKKPA